MDYSKMTDQELEEAHKNQAAALADSNFSAEEWEKLFAIEREQTARGTIKTAFYTGE